jgi:putative aminopeptidase FrvX
MIETIRKLVESYGPSGYEDQVRALILDEIDTLVDEVTVDALGSVIAWRRASASNPCRVMLAAHMDEIGLMVTHVDEKGFLRFTNVGALYPSTLIGNRVRFADGLVGAIGVEGSTNRLPKMNELFIDVSDGPGKSTVRVGDAACMDRGFIQRGDRLTAKSMGDRVGCAIQIEVMRRLEGTPNDVAFVFSVQEEVGLRGAATAAYAVDPDIGISVDVTRTGDTPKAPKTDVRLGAGPSIKIKDSRMLSAPEVVDLLESAAQAADVPVQREILTGGSTDAAAIQLSRAGVRAAGLSIPCRYIHSTSETVDLNDVENTVRLLVSLLENPVELGAD